MSRDGGLTWEAADTGRELGYCWALAVDETDPERWYVSAASGPRAAHSGTGARGRLYRWRGSWEPLGVPSDSIPYALVASRGELLVGMADGRVLSGGQSLEDWQAIDVRLESVTAMAGSD